MNLNLFIAKKIGGKGSKKGYLSSTSNIIACISVAISIFVMFMAVAVAKGFKDEIGEKAVCFSGDIVITAPGQEITNDTYPISADLSYLPEIKNIKWVNSISWVTYKSGMIKTDENVQGVNFKGVDSTYNLSFFASYLVDGELPNFSGKSVSNDILISERLAKMLGYEVGDNVTAYFVGENVRVRKFKITGLYDIRLEEIDKILTFVDIRHTQRLNGWNSSQISGMEIHLDKRADRTEIYKRVDEVAVTKCLEGDSPVVVSNVRELYPHLFDWLDLLDLNVLIVLILMIVVAGFNMISGLLIILFEKISMIGLLKALGMRTASICSIFVLRGSFIVLKGMLYGNLAAIVLGFLQYKFQILSLNPANYFVDHIPIGMDVATFLVLNVASLAMMLMILIVPSFFISGVQPDKTLKMS